MKLYRYGLIKYLNKKLNLDSEKKRSCEVIIAGSHLSLLSHLFAGATVGELVWQFFLGRSSIEDSANLLGWGDVGAGVTVFCFGGGGGGRGWDAGCV